MNWNRLMPIVLMSLFESVAYGNTSQTINLLYANLTGDECESIKTTIVTKLLHRSDLSQATAVCDSRNIESQKIRVQFSWNETPKPIQQPSLGLIAGGAGDLGFPPSANPPAYYGAFSTFSECRSWQSNFERLYAGQTGQEPVASSCYQPMMGGYALQIFAIGEQSSSLRHLEYNFPVNPSSGLLRSLKSTVESLGGNYVLTTVMDHWVSINYFSRQDLKVGVLSGTPSFQFTSIESCNVERRIVQDLFLSQFNFQFEGSSCLIDSISKSAHMINLYTKKLPPIEYPKFSEFNDWNQCDAARSDAMTAWNRRYPQKLALGFLCFRNTSTSYSPVVGYIVISAE